MNDQRPDPRSIRAGYGGVDADLGWVQRLVLLIHVAVSAAESRAGPACTRDLEGHDRAEGGPVLCLLGDDVDLRLPARGALSAFHKPRQARRVSGAVTQVSRWLCEQRLEAPAVYEQ